ncbi:hypothetical protein MMC32_003344 [Xylographa parallela]|nr:hypothetical protein [Xylographa parallela]
MVNTLGPQYSPITPIFYPWIFISCDFLSLVLQAAGGATAATASGNQTLSSDGGYVMLAGIVWQVFTLMVFGGLCGAYFQRVYVNRYNLTSSATTVFNSKRFRLFVAAVTVAYTTIFVRCVFRIAELADGWKSPIMQNEVEFIVFDGVMCLIAVLAMTIFCQGQYFPEMQEKNKAGRPDIVRHSSSLNTSDLEAATEKTTVVAK